MDHKPDRKAPRPNHRSNHRIAFADFDSDDFKRTSRPIGSPPSPSPPQKAFPGSKGNCLCSPTTHVGSFRCRHHRVSSGMIRGGSVGSNLSELGRKSSEITGSRYSP